MGVSDELTGWLDDPNDPFATAPEWEDFRTADFGDGDHVSVMPPEQARAIENASPAATIEVVTSREETTTIIHEGDASYVYEPRRREPLVFRAAAPLTLKTPRAVRIVPRPRERRPARRAAAVRRGGATRAGPRPRKADGGDEPPPDELADLLLVLARLDLSGPCGPLAADAIAARIRRLG